jgi:release factor glutamine methyltransferase
VSPGETLAGQAVDTVRRMLTARFKSAEIESPELDARLLVGAALNLDLTGIVTAASRKLTLGESSRLEGFAARRLKGEPVARVLGHKEFWGLSLKLSAATLVPRPDTETVVEQALETMRGSAARPLRIIDIGTGSGAILLALLSELANAFGVGTDISPAALATARQNARDLGLAGRAAFVACDYAAALSGPFDLIVSNPPYVRSSDIPNLARDVRDHDPLAALDGGRDGLDAYRSLVPQAARLLREGGTLVVESGLGQAHEIEGLMTQAGMKVTGPPKADMAGIPRAVTAQKMPP